MARHCFTLQVRPDRLDEYKAAHAAVWPEMLDALSRHGWEDYSLFLREDGLLIGFVESDDLDASLAGMQNEDVNARWQKEMTAFFEPLKSGAADTSLTLLERVFYLA